MKSDHAPYIPAHPAEYPIDVVLDTDTYNEIDDQFALSYLLKNEPILHTRALYAAPFYGFGNTKSVSARDGMEKSYREILRILPLCGRRDLADVTFRGSDTFLTDETTPVISDAARDLVARAMTYTAEKPLYVVAIGAITNIASALLLQPEIKESIVLVWLGGNARHWQTNAEFNASQDIAAMRVVFSSGVRLIQLPCMGVVSAFYTTEPELRTWLENRNPLCTYLLETVLREMEPHSGHIWSRVIWDVTAVAWLLPERFMHDTLLPTPIPGYDDRLTEDPHGKPMIYVDHIHRDALFEDLFRKLAEPPEFVN